MGRLAVLLTAWSRDQVPPIHPARAAQGDATHRAGAARPLPGLCPWPSGGLLSARLAVLQDCPELDQVSAHPLGKGRTG